VRPPRSRQATVRTFNPATGAGSVLLDDGREVAFDGAAFAAGGLRLLRLGQRVRLEYDDEPDTSPVRRITIATLP